MNEEGPADDRPRPTLWAEPFCGTFAVGLALLGGLEVLPPCPWQGGKAAFRQVILEVIGLAPGLGADQVLGLDVSPWADVWATLAHGPSRRAVAAQYRAWADVPDPVDWFRRLRHAAPEDPAAWLWMTSRSFSGRGPAAGCKPERHPRGHREYQPDHPVRRLDALEAVRWPAATFARASCLSWRWPLDLRGAVVYLDPPYAGTTGYRAPGQASRAEVLELALELHLRGAVVVISEAEPLALPGWQVAEITARRFGIGGRSWTVQAREFLTFNRRWTPCT